jgi:hypothetical protein
VHRSPEKNHRCSTDLPSSIASESVRITPLRVDRGNIIDPEIPPRDQRFQITAFQSTTFPVVVRHNITGVRGRFLPAPLEFSRREQNTCIYIKSMQTFSSDSYGLAYLNSFFFHLFCILGDKFTEPAVTPRY